MNNLASPQDGIFDSHLHAGSRIGIVKNADHILIRPTQIGDLNLDGAVTIGDFIDLASHFNSSGATWQEGDVNYDGNVTIADFIDLASNFNASYAGESWAVSREDAKAQAEFAVAYASEVPEPQFAAVLMGAGGFLARPRRLAGRGGKVTRTFI